MNGPLITDDTGYPVLLPVADQWYPRECPFCTRQAALECPDPVCRGARAGEQDDLP